MLDILFQDSKEHAFLRDQDGLLWETARIRAKVDEKWVYIPVNLPCIPSKSWVKYLYKGKKVPQEYIFDMELKR